MVKRNNRALVFKTLWSQKTTISEKKLLKLPNKCQAAETVTISESEHQLITQTTDSAQRLWDLAKDLIHGETETHLRLVSSSRILTQLQSLLPYQNQLKCWLAKQTKLWTPFQNLFMRMKHNNATGMIGELEISKLISKRHSTKEDLAEIRNWWASILADGTVHTNQLLWKLLANL